MLVLVFLRILRISLLVFLFKDIFLDFLLFRGIIFCFFRDKIILLILEVEIVFIYLVFDFLLVLNFNINLLVRIFNLFLFRVGYLSFIWVINWIIWVLVLGCLYILGFLFLFFNEFNFFIL